ncbi:MAG: N,N'-diacetylchitobiose phosphorylase [Anaerolineae bacterium]|nr:N,N'-diacetylchitobiose phosphorylase [Anaerolineae bacterium]
MQYGHFDDDNREYVITRPDTPRSWINYLGSRLYGGIITQNAGGYSFYKSGATGRILRMRFNGMPIDQPGRYLYIRDDDSGDYWSASWQPVGKPLDQYQCRVRHGLGYSIFEAMYAGIESTFTCFIPRGQAFEYWSIEVSNPGPEPRKLSVFSYAELTNDWMYRQDLENLQYSQYIVRMSYHDGMLRRRNFAGEWNECYFGMTGGNVVSFDTDRDIFLGPYRTPANPLAVEEGRCSDSLAVGDNACTSLHTTLELAPGEKRQVIFVLGVGAPDEEWQGFPPGREILAEYATPERLSQELASIRDEWAAHLDGLQVSTPDTNLNSMINVWHAYQTHMTFNWSRGVSLIEAGDRDGLGYRDTVQDMLAVTHSIPEAVEDRLDMILTGQTEEGGALPLVKPLTHNPGHEPTPTVEEYRSDDVLWLPITVSNFVYETGDLGYLDKVLPYADHGEATVYDHLKQGLLFSINHKGAHGLIQGLARDWNDCIHLGTTGESLFTTFLFYMGLQLFSQLAAHKGNDADVAWCAEQASEIKEQIDAHAWDGSWFLRGISESGGKLGTSAKKEGKIYLESNVWAVISGGASPEQAIQAMDSVYEHLATEYGVMLCHPGHTGPDPDVHLSLIVFPPGHKENSGIFCHSNSWAIVAECLLGRGDRAYEYYRSYLPARYNNQAEVRQVEPYVYSQFTHGRPSPRFGQSRNPWLTGTASWTYIAATQYLLGIRPELDGLRIDPCISDAWEGFEVQRRFRGKDLTIRVQNPDGVQRGVQSMTLNGQAIEGNLVPVAQLADTNIVEVTLG